MSNYTVPSLTVDKETVAPIEARRPKIGFLGLAFFEYWRMHGVSVLKDVEEKFKTIVNDLESRGQLDIVNPGLVDTLEKAIEAARVFKKEEVDMIVIYEGTYAPDYYIVQLLDQLPPIPIFILVMQETNRIPLDLDYIRMLKASGLIGLVQLTGDFSKTGKKFGLAVGAIGDEKTYRRVESYAKAVFTVNKLRNINIGVIGRVFRGMYELEWDKTKVKWKLGPNIFYIEISELLDLLDKVPPSDTKKLVEELKKKYKVNEITDEDIAKACRLSIALERLVSRFKLNALSHLCQWYLHCRADAPPCFGCSMLNEQGIMTTCEGDIGTLVAMCILNMLTEGPAFFGEWSLFDEQENSILIGHHGLGNPKLASDSSEIKLTSHFENWGYTGAGLAFEFIGKPGRVTMASLIDDVEGMRMLITGGESLDVPTRPMHTAHYIIKVERPVREYLELLLKKGVSHHVAIVHGDVREELEYVADLLGIGKFVL